MVFLLKGLVNSMDKPNAINLTMSTERRAKEQSNDDKKNTNNDEGEAACKVIMDPGPSRLRKGLFDLSEACFFQPFACFVEQ